MKSKIDPDPLDEVADWIKEIASCKKFKYICGFCGEEVCGACEVGAGPTLHNLMRQ